MSFSFGEKIRLHVFGASHAQCVGAILEGIPANLKISEQDIQKELDRRKPGSSALVSQRKEEDKLQILSGIKNGKTTGSPIVLLIQNKDVDSSAYEKISKIPRPGHADLSAYLKYGKDFDIRGGSFFSGRMTAAYVMAGAVAKSLLLSREKTRIIAHVVQIGKVKVEREVSDLEIEKNAYSSEVRCAIPSVSEKMKSEVEKARSDGDSVGGIIECRILNLPAGIGDPIFDSIESVVSHAIFSIPAVKGIEFGSGFRGSFMRGSENNDSFEIRNGKIVSKTNNSGGILGGISDGMPIFFRAAMKPTPSIAKKQQTVNLETMKNTEIAMEGRHDPCIAIRAVPVVECMSALALADLLLRKN